MSSKAAVLTFLNSSLDWTKQSIQFVKRRNYLNSKEKSRVYSELNKHVRHIELSVAEYSADSNLSAVTAESALNEFIARQGSINRAAILYQFAPYPLPELADDQTLFGLSIRVNNDSNAPVFFTGDYLHVVHVKPEQYGTFKGDAIIAYQPQRNKPRQWKIGRLEPLNHNQFDLTHYNPAFEGWNTVANHSEVPLLFRVVSVQRDREPQVHPKQNTDSLSEPTNETDSCKNQAKFLVRF